MDSQGNRNNDDKKDGKKLCSSLRDRKENPSGISWDNLDEAKTEEERRKRRGGYNRMVGSFLESGQRSQSTPPSNLGEGYGIENAALFSRSQSAPTTSIKQDDHDNGVISNQVAASGPVDSLSRSTSLSSCILNPSSPSVSSSSSRSSSSTR